MSEQNNKKEKETKKTIKRDLLLNDYVTEETMGKLIQDIIAINRHDDEHSPDNREPIKIIINSFGGNVYDVNMAISVVEYSQTPVHTYCFGKAMSAGLQLYLSGHKRFASPLATFMQHDMAVGIHGKIEHLQESLEWNTRLRDSLEEYIYVRTKLPKQLVENYRSRKQDFYMTAQEAYMYGIVDEIISFRN